MTNKAFVLNDIANNGDFTREEQEEIRRATNRPEYRKLMNATYSGYDKIDAFYQRAMI